METAVVYESGPRDPCRCCREMNDEDLRSLDLRPAAGRGSLGYDLIYF
jgi:hypothetical protein